MAWEIENLLFGLGIWRIGRARGGRALALLLCFVLPGCSFFWEDIQQQPEPAPVVAALVNEIKQAADSEKVPTPLEVAGPIAANSISVAPWIICLRSGASAQTRARVFSVFFRDGKISLIQASAIIDGCETQTFVPLQTNTATAQAPGSAHSASKRP